jgi:hypothetical protein
MLTQSKGRHRAALATLFLALWAGSLQAAERVGDFALLDQQGRFHHMSWYDDHKAIAFLVQVNGSQQTAQAAAEYARLQSAFDSQGIEFMMINPLGEPREAVRQQAESLGVNVPVLIDDSQVIADAMGIDKSGEAFLYDPRSFEVIFRGPVSALEGALTELVAGSPVSTPVVAMEGADVSYPAMAQHAANGISYTTDIAPIIAQNCATCHREGGIAPFAMDSHAMVQGWSPMIREVLMTKRMPPGQLDPHVGNFSNDYVLDVADQQKLVQWIDAGAQKDGSADPLAALTWPESKWAFGEPDLIVKIPPSVHPCHWRARLHHGDGALRRPGPRPLGARQPVHAGGPQRPAPYLECRHRPRRAAAQLPGRH